MNNTPLINKIKDCEEWFEEYIRRTTCDSNDKYIISELHGFTREQLEYSKTEWNRIMKIRKLEGKALEDAKYDRKKITGILRDKKSKSNLRQKYDDLTNSYKQRIAELTIENAEIRRAYDEVNLKYINCKKKL